MAAMRKGFASIMVTALLAGLAGESLAQTDADPPGEGGPVGELVGPLDEEEQELLREALTHPLLPPGPAPASTEAIRQAGAPRPTARLLVRLSRSPGEQDEREDSLFPGSLAAMSARLSLNLCSDLRADLAASRARGELWKDGRFGGTLSYQGTALPGRILLGDYTLGGGQGLLFGGRGAWSGTGRPGCRKEELAPSGGSGIRGAMRGLALTADARFGTTSLRTTVCLSHRALDATLRDDLTAAGLDWDAPARTASERARRATVTEDLLGVRLSLAGSRWGVGFSWFRSRYSHPVFPSSGLGFSGESARLFGADGTVGLGKLTVFAEIACSLPAGVSAVGGLELHPASQTTLRIAWRSFGLKFANPRGISAGRHRDGSNERALSLALHAAPARGTTVEAEADIYGWPGPVYRDPLPSGGMTMSAGCTADLDSAVSGQLRLRLRRWESLRTTASAAGEELHERVESRRLSLSALLRCRLTPLLTWRSQLSVAGVRHSRALDEGRALLMSAGLLLEWAGWRGELRCTLFSGADGDLPLVDAEPEPAQSFGATVLSGQGSRYMGAVQWVAGPNLTVSAKCSATFPGPDPRSAPAGGPPLVRFALSALTTL
ncbi:MAG TPA: hypothetical protein VF889_01275 [Bacteroidota bacterium]